MRDDLATVPAVITLSRRVVTVNLVIAAVIITALATWDLAGHLPLPLGVLGHEGSTVIVGLNGLRVAARRRLAQGDHLLLADRQGDLGSADAARCLELQEQTELMSGLSVRPDPVASSRSPGTVAAMPIPGIGRLVIVISVGALRGHSSKRQLSVID
jgi:hypothetical protein